MRAHGLTSTPATSPTTAPIATLPGGLATVQANAMSKSRARSTRCGSSTSTGSGCSLMPPTLRTPPKLAGRNWINSSTQSRSSFTNRVSKIASGSVSKDVIGSARRVTTREALPELAFESLVAADARRLYTLALSILRDEGEAEDAVQETLFKAWRSWPSIGDSDHLPRWLTRVCVNHCTSVRRRLRARGGPPLELFEWAGSSG